MGIHYNYLISALLVGRSVKYVRKEDTLITVLVTRIGELGTTLPVPTTDARYEEIF
jgi:hypothetical protein